MLPLFTPGHAVGVVVVVAGIVPVVPIDTGILVVQTAPKSLIHTV